MKQAHLSIYNSDFQNRVNSEENYCCIDAHAHFPSCVTETGVKEACTDIQVISNNIKTSKEYSNSGNIHRKNHQNLAYWKLVLELTYRKTCLNACIMHVDEKLANATEKNRNRICKISSFYTQTSHGIRQEIWRGTRHTGTHPFRYCWLLRNICKRCP